MTNERLADFERRIERLEAERPERVEAERELLRLHTRLASLELDTRHPYDHEAEVARFERRLTALENGEPRRDRIARIEDRLRRIERQLGLDGESI